MLKGLVIGTATATVKHSSMQRQRLLVVQPQLVNGKPDGDPLLAVDIIGAGVGETVMLTSDGRGAREYLKVDATPVRWTTIGIAD
ncbi:MAG: EutN/CcmL family microcompartment protein [Planctomycetaceae bacterium]|nr:EutN/CcmL family microcompartment protein [Planctomycetales bacterium]MCB9927012.1 EutN/CcmL family microcompartment protein [Planctomycetaceae bacterium]